LCRQTVRGHLGGERPDRRPVTREFHERKAVIGIETAAELQLLRDVTAVYDLSLGRSTRMIVRIYSGDDGQTHFEDLPLPTRESHNVAVQAGANVVFRRFPADYWSDWHTAPRRQYIFVLEGQVEIGIGDGTTRRFGPGDVILADDLTGQGHTTRSLGVPRISATVAVGA
jgi:hypothetical protein